jgi:AcrR family transcriptional regulator
MGSRERNPERSRERILAAALDEFAERGFAGARVESIAHRAGLNKQLISHYFGGKQTLYDAVMSVRRAAAGGELTNRPRAMPDAIEDFFDRAVSDPSWARVLLWEALESEQVAGVDEMEQRRRRYAERVTWVQDEQEAGRLPDGLEPDLLLLTLFGAATYPVLLPEVAALVTGDRPGTERFDTRYRHHLEALAAKLAG